MVTFDEVLFSDGLKRSVVTNHYLLYEALQQISKVFQIAELNWLNKTDT